MIRREHWFTKKWLNNLAFSLKSVMNFFSWKRGGTQGTFLLFKNVFNMDQYFCGLERGSANLIDNLVQYFSFDSSIDTCHWYCNALNFLRRNMFLLEQQYYLNAKFFSVIKFWISLFIQSGSLLSRIIVSCEIKC